MNFASLETRYKLTGGHAVPPTLIMQLNLEPIDYGHY